MLNKATTTESDDLGRHQTKLENKIGIKKIIEVTSTKHKYLHFGDHFCHNELHIFSGPQSRQRVPELHIKLRVNFKKNPLQKALKMKTYGLNHTLISSLVTPESKLETYNFVPISIPGIPAALRLSSNKSCCHGKFLVLRTD